VLHQVRPILAVAASLATVVPAAALSTPVTVPHQRSTAGEKESRTPAQQKINSQILYEIYRLRGEAEMKGVPAGKTGVRIDMDGRALVDVRVKVTQESEKAVRRAGGTITSKSARYDTIIAWVPLRNLEKLAGNPAVRAIEPAADAITNR
jgi:hypothetical protein